VLIVLPLTGADAVGSTNVALHIVS